ncbi:MAG: hypothetical protein EOP10_04070 [Proteobacteria bacterium]|nr:MAG: hypothetical protein EOP10_04070 [Pseudomonadota bacterium]
MRRHQWLLSLSLATMTAFSFGCEDDDDNDVIVEAASPSPTTPTPGLTSPTVEATLPGNTFESTCLETRLLDMMSTTRRLVFGAAGELSKTETFFLGDDCGTSPYLVYESTGTYSDKGPNSDLVGSNNIDFAIQSTSLTPLSELLVVSFNTRQYCGKKDWVLDQKVDVTGLSCDSLSLNTATQAADIYVVEDDVLYLGSTFNYDSAKDATRPTSVDRDVSYRIPSIQ